MLIPLSASAGKLLCSEILSNIVLKIAFMMDSVLRVNNEGISMESSLDAMMYIWNTESAAHHHGFGT